MDHDTKPTPEPSPFPLRLQTHTCRSGEHQGSSLQTFEELRIRWPWRPIRNCPGRFVLPRLETPVSFEMLLGMPCSPQTFSSHQAKDRVLVWPLQDGGLITYEQPDGRFIHTLNTLAGFSRKLDQLGITLSRTKTPYKE